ncbi:LLM class flavin-dependent oxidoreductase [Actinokineospora diospyrosa]|uniref:Luciferase-like monooxygenase n=1 Tax=Actinokineospora diospyrosa TaxID=103728 RepID=A0ABT1ILX5_9PSEU|nr:LLM class flavin-dependent oxidoreductase [Actinokineospora diospyrosa]MCP2273659.1 Luciferase-like monooxygenase [Actinokineospora diospyrosa]
MSLFLAVELDGAGAHPAAWRASGAAPAAVILPGPLREIVTAAEEGGFTLATFADSPVPPSIGVDIAGRLEAVGRAAFVSTTTSRIGLAPSVPTATTEPFHLAAQIASLDHASRGRAAWVVEGSDSAELATVGTDGPPGEAAEVVAVVRALWDSWEDDAVIKDVATGRYLDPDKVHHVDFVGSSFSVKGPLITPRPPQGQPVVLAADTLGVAADIALVSGQDRLRERADAARDTGAGLVFAEVEVVLDAHRPAASRLADLNRATPWTTRRTRYTGSAEGLVALLADLAGTFDGVRLHPAVLAVDLPLLVEQVLPALDIPARGDTLRASLGLVKPTNRFEGSTR